jgi:hypothetical protein
LDTIILNDPEHGDTVARLAGIHYNPKNSANICRVRDGLFLGGVIYTQYNGESIVAHTGAVSPYWFNRDMIFVAFDYPFHQLGVKRIFGFVPEDKWHVQEFNRKMGFKVVTRIEGMFKHNIACIVMRLDHEDCRLFHVKPRNIKRNFN